MTSAIYYFQVFKRLQNMQLKPALNQQAVHYHPETKVHKVYSPAYFWEFYLNDHL